VYHTIENSSPGTNGAETSGSAEGGKSLPFSFALFVEGT
jgi:hypothetical protein